MPTLNFKGKSFVQNHHYAVPYRQLIPSKDKSLTDKISLHDNLIIHGDNLAALKALLPTYAGKVKCIYIDPPYNTGNEGWIYNDNVNSPMMQEWLGKVVDKEDFTRHDKWLCMMTPRLKLLRELLREDGVIFVSIDDNEVHHLRMLMDEVFGEENTVASFIWKHRKSSQNDIDLSLSHNYIICYSKNRIYLKLLPLGIDIEKFANPDNDQRGNWVADPMDAPGIRENLTYKIKNPKTNKIFLPPEGRHWRFTQEKYLQALADSRIVFGKKGVSKPQYKRFQSEAEIKGKVTFTIWDEIGTATEGTKELMKIFDGKKIFDTPKPKSLLDRILRLSSDNDSIILDSFAGSGTTAHAVLALNKEDGGNRKFILVECEDYADTITAERVRRVIKGVPEAKDVNLKSGLGGAFSYFELGDPIEMHSILEGDQLPSYMELARYVFYTATGDEFVLAQVNEKDMFIGSSREYDVYLMYKPDMDYIQSTALTLSFAEQLPPHSGKKRLVFAPQKYLDVEYLNRYRIEFCQLPFEIYRFQE